MQFWTKRIKLNVIMDTTWTVQRHSYKMTQPREQHTFYKSTLCMTTQHWLLARLSVYSCMCKIHKYRQRKSNCNTTSIGRLGPTEVSTSVVNIAIKVSISVVSPILFWYRSWYRRQFFNAISIVLSAILLEWKFADIRYRYSQQHPTLNHDTQKPS